MKSFCIFFFACAIQFSAFAQDTILTYLDKSWKETTKENAAYFRKTVQTGPTRFDVSDYFINGTLQMHGTYSDEKLSVSDGYFTYYSENGVLLTESNYSGDQLDGKRVHYYENGQLSSDESWKAGKKNGTLTYYRQDGSISYVEERQLDSLLSWKCFREDGTLSTDPAEFNRVAEFPGGREAMVKFVGDNIIYPKTARKEGLEGKCFVQFMVTNEGQVSDVKIIRGVPGCRECDLEAVRVVRMMPDWIPAIDHNRPVDSYFNLPVTYQLEKAEKRKRKN